MKKTIAFLAFFFAFLGVAEASNIITSSGVWRRDGDTMKLNPSTLNVDIGGNLSVAGSLTAGGVSLTGGLSVSDTLTISGATPSLIMKDTDNTDDKSSIVFDSNCPTTGSGIEACDFTISTRLAGALTPIIRYASSDGSLYLGALEHVRLANVGAYIALSRNVLVSNNILLGIGPNANLGFKQDTNGTGNSIPLMRFNRQAGGTNCLLIGQDIDPNNMTILDDCISPTFIFANQNGADPQDAIMTMVGPYNDTVTGNNNFYFNRFLAAMDGVLDETTAEVVGNFYFGGASDTTVNTLTPVSLVNKNDFETQSKVYMTDIARDYTGTCGAGEFFIDTGGASTEICHCQVANTPFCAEMYSGVFD